MRQELPAIASSAIDDAALFGARGAERLVRFHLPRHGANILNLNPFWRRIVTGGPNVIVVSCDGVHDGKR
jgi:ribose transport system permease protein